jgi:hypothetical protein
MFPFVFNDHDRLVGEEYATDVLPWKHLNQGVHDLAVGHAGQRLRGPQLQAMLTGDPVISPLDLEEDIPARTQ